MGHTQGKLPDQFTVLVDESWSGKTARRFLVDKGSLDLAVKSAVEKGVAGFICSTSFAMHPALRGHNVFYGDDSRDLYFRLAEILRDHRGDKTIAAVTGSSGKTTTKRMLAHALRASGDNESVTATPRSVNIYPEVVKHLSRAALSSHTVVEVSGTAFKQFRKNDFTVSADVSIVTSISEAHLNIHRSVEQVAREKSEIFDRPPTGGAAIINIDTKHSEILVERAINQGCQIITYGESPKASIRLLEYRVDTGQVSARVGGETLHYALGARGKHMALNSLAVVAALRNYRLPDWRAGMASLADFDALEGRGSTS